MTEEQALQMHAEGQQLQSNGAHHQALDRFAQAAAYFESAEGPESPDLANVLADQAQACLFLCRFPDAEQWARKMKEIVDAIRPRLDCEARAALGPRSHDLWGRTLRELNRYPEAAVEFDAAIAEAESIFGTESVEVAPYLNSMGVLCKYWGKFDEGERVYLRALALLEREHGKEHMETAIDVSPVVTSTTTSVDSNMPVATSPKASPSAASLTRSAAVLGEKRNRPR